MTVYEPDPLSCEMIETNLKLNNLKANIINKAVNYKKGVAYLSTHPKGQFWRNSISRDFGTTPIKVDCLDFNEIVTDDSSVKMDIEGSEIGILENIKSYPKKMVFEWSFDIDNSIDKYKAVCEGLEKHYNTVYWRKDKNNYKYWSKSWFPLATNVFCL